MSKESVKKAAAVLKSINFYDFGYIVNAPKDLRLPQKMCLKLARKIVKVLKNEERGL